jgi:hypothetical protein
MRWLWLGFVIVAAVGWAAQGSAESQATATVRDRDRDVELARQPSWAPPSRGVVRDRALNWAAEAAGTGDAAGRSLERATRLWSESGPGSGETSVSGEDLIATAMETAAIIDPRAAAVRGHLDDSGSLATAAAWLREGDTDQFERDAVKLWLGRELVRRDRFDEALPLLVDLDLAAAIDPAALLFYRGCCEHWLLAREAAAESLDRLLEREAEIPVRYARLARLLRADIAGLEDDSLDHIARRMRDVHRRLGLGRAGPATRDVQEGVVASLDRLIEEIENKQQQGQSAAAGAGSAGDEGGSRRPMDDSRIAGGRGAGEVQKRDLGSGDGWGNLPPHEREAALQQIGREYPPHYREAIEQYFKRLATGEDRGP